MANIYGYIRVSSVDQNEDRQRIALGKLGIQPKRIFMDKQSCKDFHRPQYQAFRADSYFQKGASIWRYLIIEITPHFVCRFQRKPRIEPKSDLSGSSGLTSMSATI